METTALEHGIAPENVHETLRRWMLADGFPFVLDLESSRGTTLVDSRSGRGYLDFFGCFGSNPLGWNHPALRDPAWLRSVEGVVANRPSNSDLYTQEMADFVASFGQMALPAGYRHCFFVDGGALAVENALKAAFDWKIRRNRAKGVNADIGTRILHFRHAFHGRSGYTMSMTNTLAVKTDLYPKFDWPRVSSPALRFPVTETVVRETIQAENAALAEIDAAFARYGDDLAAILIEPIQCEGGDRHFRAEFLQALQARCERYDCLFICDEVQTGFFTSGKPWAFQHYGIQPDLVSFGKKAQQCGFFAGPKIDLVPGNVFETPGRINSTWGGNLVDMARSTRILQVIREERLADNAAAQGARWLEGMKPVVAGHPQILSNPRGLGLLMAFDLPNGEARDGFLTALREVGLLGLRCGERTVRFRPHLAVGAEDVDQALSLTAAAAARFLRN